jgi:hypothetical protein
MNSSAGDVGDPVTEPTRELLEGERGCFCAGRNGIRTLHDCCTDRPCNGATLVV